jgi:glycosyltransferase involved in cell wall biosynthesis
MGDTSICFITPGHLASNPRLVKEASAASEAGYDVSVIFNQYFLPEVCENDENILAQHPAWNTERIEWTTQSWTGRARRIVSGARRRAARWLFHDAGWKAAAPWAQGRTYSEMLRATRKRDADLYVAHNLAALPAAAHAAESRNAKLGFDAEDFHRGELLETPENEATLRLTRYLEETYMPRCDYLTAASDCIAEAYADALDVPRPTTILNVFPRSERENGSVSEDTLRREKQAGTRSLYWFSQTIGPDRGLEDALNALPLLADDVHLYLRGTWASGYEEAFMQRAAALDVADRVHHLPLVPPDELILRTARHDVGLALEPGRDENNRIAVSNKLFTYLLAGVPFVATDTDGQRRVCADLPDATRTCSIGDAETLAGAVRSLLSDDEMHRAARQAAWQAGEERYNWAVEKEKFLRTVAATLGASVDLHPAEDA